MNEPDDRPTNAGRTGSDPVSRRARNLLVLSGLLLLALFVVLGALTEPHPLGIDLAVRDGLKGHPGHELWTRPLGTVAGVLSDILGPVLPIIFGFGMLIWALVAWRRRHKAQAFLLLRLLIVLLLCRSTGIIAKPLFHRERPRIYPDFSYPSGHVTSVATTAFVVFLVFLHLARKTVLWVTVIMGLLTVVAALDRLVLGVHWFTDTVGAVLGVLGVGLLASVALGLLPVDEPTPPETEEGVISPG